MDATLLRQIEALQDHDAEHGNGSGSVPGRSTVTSRLTPAPQVVFRVSDPETARALGESLSGGGGRGGAASFARTAPTEVARVAESPAAEAPAAGGGFEDPFGMHLMPVQRKARDENGVAPDAEHAVATAASSAGSPLPTTVQRTFESSLGVDLSGVRVHTGSESQTAAHAVGAKAYTVGNDIHFASGQYDPSSGGGQHLLAHEVAHTVQQSGGAAIRQNKLEVSAPQDALETEADRAADAMVAGLPAAVGGGGGLSRKIHRDIDTGSIQGAGDEAQANAMKAPLSIDKVNVSSDSSRANEIVADIDKHMPVLKEAHKENEEVETQYGAIGTSTATKANLSIFKDKVDVSSVDTSAFAVQYRLSFADYQRLKAEAAEVTAHAGSDSKDPIGDVGNDIGKTNNKLGEGQVGLARFRAARNNLHTAGKKMDAQLTKCRGAANLLQGAVYKAKAAAASAKGEDAAKNLAAVRAEIEAVAAGVGKVVKMASAVAGLAGGGGATNALAKPAESGGHVDIDPSISGLGKGGTVLTPGEGNSKAALMQAMGTDLSSLVGGGDPAEFATGLVKAIGEYANKDKIVKLQQQIVEAAAQEKSFNAAGDASSFVGYQETLDGASKELANLLTAFDQAKKEMADASDALMAELNKGGKKGKDQAKAVLFLGDADRFLAQVNNAIAVGENQQKNLKDAALDRKKLRGTTGTVENEPDRQTQVYFRCQKTVTAGKLWGTNNHFKLEKVDVAFQNSGGFGENDINQGGGGSVEGTGSAEDGVKRKIDVLVQAKEQVTKLQGQVQGSLGLGGPIMNA